MAGQRVTNSLTHDAATDEPRPWSDFFSGVSGGQVEAAHAGQASGIRDLEISGIQASRHVSAAAAASAPLAPASAPSRRGASLLTAIAGNRTF